MSVYEQLLYEVRNSAAFLTLNRPDKRNALGEILIRELKSALAESETDEAVKVIVVRGAGKDFCAGADLAQLQKVAENSVLDNLDDAASFAALLLQIRQAKKPVIAAVHGRALAGGAGLAVACDLVIAGALGAVCFYRSENWLRARDCNGCRAAQFEREARV